MSTILVTIIYINKHDCRINPGNRYKTFVEAHRLSYKCANIIVYTVLHSTISTTYKSNQSMCFVSL